VKPEKLSCVGFSAIKCRDPNRLVPDLDAAILQDLLAECGFIRQQAKGNQIVCLAATHCLLETENPLIATPPRNQRSVGIGHASPR
jgi:hypothetical protein